MLAKSLYALLSLDSTLSGLVGSRVSPYVRNRDDDFPAVVYTIDDQELDTDSTGSVTQRNAGVTITALARGYIEAEDCGEAILDAIDGVSGTYASSCIKFIRPVSIRRDFGDPFDGSTDLVYRVHVDAQIQT